MVKGAELVSRVELGPITTWLLMVVLIKMVNKFGDLRYGQAFIFDKKDK